MGANPYSPESNLSCTHCAEQDGSRHPQSFASLYDLNRQTISLLVDIAATPLSNRIWPTWRTLGNELARLDAAQREDLAHCPFSLVDAGLHEAPRRSRAAHPEPAEGELPFTPVLLQTRLDHLAHAAWLLAWHLARSDTVAARLVLAMDSASTSLMAQLTLTDIRRIAHEQVDNGHVCPRWHTRPDIWSRLIQTARSSHLDVFANVTTRGLQFFLQELLAGDQGA